MNIFHFILLALAVFGVIPSINTAIKERKKIGLTVVILVVLMWCALIILSAYY